MPDFSSLIAELRRRNVLKAGGAYVAGGWVFFQFAETLLPLVGTPDWVLQALMILLMIGLPFVLVFSWAFELTPEGLKRTEDVDPAVSQTKETGRKIQYLIIGLLAVAVVGLLVDRFASTPSRSTASAASVSSAVAFDFPDDVEAVAVMPFKTSGPDTDVWGEGMMSMLTTNLDGMGGLRAIDTRTVLARLRERTGTVRGADLATMISVARAMQASMALVGDVVSTGETARLTATLYDTDSGDVLGRLQVEGAADDLLQLVDQLTVQAVEAAQAAEATSGAALPVPDLSALTTESLPALRAYLRGEQRLRQSLASDALEPLERSVRLDSTFAMAHFRLATAYSATRPGSVNDAQIALAKVREHLRAADRYGDRLPPRERAHLDSRIAKQIDNEYVQAAQILQAALQRFPTDPELWLEYGGTLSNPVIAWHVEAPVTSSQAAAKVLALDSTMTPAYIGLTARAIARGDTAQAKQLLKAYARHAGPESVESGAFEAYEAALQLAYGSTSQQRTVIDRLRAGDIRVNYLTGALGRNPSAPVLRAKEQVGDIVAETQGYFSLRNQAQIYSGQYGKLKAFTRDTTLTSLSARLNRSWAALTLLSRGAIDAAMVPARLGDGICRMAARPWYRLPGCYVTARLSLFRQEAGLPGPHAARIRDARAILRESIPALEDADEAMLADFARGYLGVLDGLDALRAGRSEAHAVLDSAHVQLAGVFQVGGMWNAMEQQVRTLIAGEEAERALPYAAMIASEDPYGHYLAGRAHEAAGHSEAAREAYEQFVRAWRDADSNIPDLQYARAALDNLAPEAPPL